MFWPKRHDLHSIIHNRTIALSCSRAFDRHTAVSVTVMAPGEDTSCHLGGRETIRTNQAEIHNVPVTGSRFVWLDAHANGRVTFCHRSMQVFLGNVLILGSYLRLKGQRQWVHTCQSEEKELRTNQINIRMWTSCFVSYMKRDSDLYILFFQPAVLDNLLTSMKFVLHGMGVLRINLANSKNKVWTRLFPFCCSTIYLFITQS